jgi:hypothetical protein
MSGLIQIADEPTDIKMSDRVKLISEDVQQCPMLTYLWTHTKSASYFSQVMSMAMNLNISARNEFDPASLDGALRVLRGEYARESIWKTAHFYQAQLLACEFSGKIAAPMTRPAAGSIHNKANAATICRFTGLAQLVGWDIGNLAHVTDDLGNCVGIRLTELMLRHHFCIAGTTGAGKSNAGSNIICAALEADYAVNIFDHKPDYIEIDEPNPDAPRARSIKDVKFWTLGPMERKDFKHIKVSACELNPEMLAGTIFWRNGEENQSECFAFGLQAFIKHREEEGREKWEWDEFVDWFSRGKQQIEKDLGIGVKLHEATYGVTMRKLKSPTRLPSWIKSDGIIQKPVWRQALKKDIAFEGDDFFQSIKSKMINVIRIGGDSRSYGLFLDYALNKITELRLSGGPKVCNFIDEASTIFKSGNFALQKLATASLTHHTSQARSLRNSFVFVAQSAGDIPPEIRQNLNSLIVFKHKHPSILRDVLPEQANDIFGVVNNLQPGEAIIELFGVRGLLHANMHLSPFKLFDPEKSTRGFAKSSPKQHNPFVMIKENV